MSDKFTNNVRARLYKQGYQGFTKDDYTSAALAVECDDLDNPTKEQLSQAVDYLKVKSTSQLSVVDELVEETFLVGLEDAQPDPELDNSQLTVASQEINSITVTSEDKRQIVTAQSSALGFELTEQETLSIALNVDDTFTDYSQFIITVTAAIKNYVDQKFDVIEQSFETNAQDLREHVSSRASRLNQKVNNFSGDIKADMGVIRQNIKSTQFSILARLNAAQ
jgi:ribosome-associated translation inhibitor RaiA